MMLRCCALLIAASAFGCSAGVVEEQPQESTHDDPHAIGDAGSSTHPVRDLATQPCNVDNWQRLSLDLRQCDLAGAALSDANLRRANLNDANLNEANLAGADLFKALLVGANAARAKLVGANLTSADLTNIDLSGADLTGARLTNANLKGATFEGAKTDTTTVCPSGTPGPCW